jgi:hypothetical protein
MSVSCDVRIRSFSFLRELLIRYNPGIAEFDVTGHLKSLNGFFYTQVGIFLKPQITELSYFCSDLFPSDSGSFLWEAVRCTRSITEKTDNYILLSPNKWITEMMVPWCRFVNLSAINTDMVNAEFFRFLMERAFEDDENTIDIVNCWAECAKSPEHGMVNASVLLGTIKLIIRCRC